jgi:hypothetical protein
MIQFIYGSGKGMELEAELLELASGGSLWLMDGSWDEPERARSVAKYKRGRFECSQRVFPGVRPLRPQWFSVNAPGQEEVVLRVGDELSVQAKAFKIETDDEGVTVTALPNRNVVARMHADNCEWYDSQDILFEASVEIATAAYFAGEFFAPSTAILGPRFRPSALAERLAV